MDLWNVRMAIEGKDFDYPLVRGVLFDGARKAVEAWSGGVVRFYLERNGASTVTIPADDLEEDEPKPTRKQIWQKLDDAIRLCEGGLLPPESPTGRVISNSTTHPRPIVRPKQSPKEEAVTVSHNPYDILPPLPPKGQARFLTPTVFLTSKGWVLINTDSEALAGGRLERFQTFCQMVEDLPADRIFHNERWPGFVVRTP